MLFFSYTRIVAKVSFIPLAIVIIVGWILVKNSTIITEGIMNALIELAIWFGGTFGMAGGIVTAIIVIRRRARYRSLARSTISQVYGPRLASGNLKEIPVIDWTLKPQEIEPVKGVMINGTPIEEWQKQHP